MLRNTFQSGYLSLLFSLGNNPLQIWDKHASKGTIQILEDDDIKSEVIELSSNTVCETFISCPISSQDVLAIKLPFLILVIRNMEKYFSFEIHVLDSTGVQRRFCVNNFQTCCRIKPEICTVPLRMEPGWNTVQFNLMDFTKRAYGTNFIEAQRIIIYANCRVRRVFFSDKPYREDEIPTVLVSNKTGIDLMPSLNYNFKLNIALMNWGYLCTSPSKYLMINARSDNLFKVKKYEEAMMMNRRCVILADGYYETCQETNKKHFMFLPAPPEYSMKVIGEDERYNRRLMHMAGIFIENNQTDDKAGFSFVIITVDASESVSKIHSRMPAILETDEDVLKWLNPDEYPSTVAARLLKPVECNVMETNVKIHCHVPDKDGSIQMRITDFMKPPSTKKQKC
ncbi:hypothetical protein D917_05810 [Trichinella nativa]|uniref:Abasic site processing protein HMCES n=2 Tax=Trichinella nativa TaxID=6335 RepID=A0A1Y3EW37_9BILA|nr:hypothetical protein D917_05810 [Trichinella nativa]